MRFAFTEDQTMLREAFAEALSTECTPEVVRESWDGPVEGLWEAVAEQGVLGINLPEDHGGLAMGPLEWVGLMEEAGRFALPVPLLETLASNPALVESGRTELAERVATGEARVSLGVAGGYVVDADVADLILVLRGAEVMAVADPVLTAQTSIDGSRRIFSVDGRLEAVEADGVAMFDRAALASAAQLVGVSRKLLELSVSYVKDRKQFGKPIGSFQALQHQLADTLLKIKFAAPVVYQAAWSMAEGSEDASLHASMAKAYASDCAEFAARRALQCHGAIGYTFEYDLHLWMKRAWALRAAWGDAAFHRDRIGHVILGGSDA